MMLDMLTHPAAFPFACALSVMVLLAGLEIISLLIGAQLSGILDSLLPSLDVDADVDGGHGSFGAVLVWLKIDQLPLLMVLIVFLTLFGLIGLGLQAVIAEATGAPLSMGVAIILALIASILPLRYALMGLARVMPRDETEAVSRDSLVGLTGTIVLGTAQQASPAQAKVTNEMGQTHYVMVEPETAGERFSAGDAIQLMSLRGNVFMVRGTPRIATQVAIPEEEQ